MTDFCGDCGRASHGEFTCEQARDMRTTNHAARVRAELRAADKAYTSGHQPPAPPDEAAIAEERRRRHARARAILDERAREAGESA